MELPDRRESGRAPLCRSLHANEEQQEASKVIFPFSFLSLIFLALGFLPRAPFSVDGKNLGMWQLLFFLGRTFSGQEAIFSPLVFPLVNRC